MILHEFHTSFARRHSGIEVTKKIIRNHFYWKGLKHDVKTFVQQCELCQRNKSKNIARARVLKPL